MFKSSPPSFPRNDFPWGACFKMRGLRTTRSWRGPLPVLSTTFIRDTVVPHATYIIIRVRIPIVNTWHEVMLIQDKSRRDASARRCGCCGVVELTSVFLLFFTSCHLPTIIVLGVPDHTTLCEVHKLLLQAKGCPSPLAASEHQNRWLEGAPLYHEKTE